MSVGHWVTRERLTKSSRAICEGPSSPMETPQWDPTTFKFVWEMTPMRKLSKALKRQKRFFFIFFVANPHNKKKRFFLFFFFCCQPSQQQKCFYVMASGSLNSVTVGAWIPNKFKIRMVHSRSVLVPTIWKQNFQNGRSTLDCFIYKYMLTL